MNFPLLCASKQTIADENSNCHHAFILPLINLCFVHIGPIFIHLRFTNCGGSAGGQDQMASLSRPFSLGYRYDAYFLNTDFLRNSKRNFEGWWRRNAWSFLETSGLES